jgi:pimeloyl-ACP methyl ester carboxylesterase
MRAIQRVVAPVAAVAHAARRPATYGGHLKELSSTIVTAGVYPFGFRDAGFTPDARFDDSPVDTPVLLVHGYGANKSNWLFVTRYLRQAGFERVHALNYNPLAADIPALAAQCAERADQVREHFGTERIHVIGHSLGGIIARYAVQVHGLRDVGVCVSVASPHGGVRMARHGSPIATLSPFASGVQLRPDSSVMTLLRHSAQRSSTRWVAYYSNLDLIVPARRAMILEPELEATNILVKDTGHLSIMLSRRLSSSIVDQLGAAEGLAGYGSPVSPLATPSTDAGAAASAADGARRGRASGE